jgi:putative oxidoreductase
MVISRIYRALLSLDSILAGASPAVSFAIRCYVSWQFLKSGWLKLVSWDSTRYLFRHEYSVPLLNSDIAAIIGTANELALPVLLIVGLATRMTAIALFAFNIVAVLSYSSVLLATGNEAALGSHILWGGLLLVPIFYGGQNISLDFVFRRHLGFREIKT